MAHIQIWFNEIQDGGKISSTPCGEKDVEQKVADFQEEYGIVTQIVVENGDTFTKKGNPKYRFHLFTEKHFMLISCTEKQFQRLFKVIVTDEFENFVLSDGSVSKDIFKRKEGEIMDENVGYDRDFVLLKAGEFECDGKTFTYEGEPITVGVILDNQHPYYSFKTAEGYSAHFSVIETHHIKLYVTAKGGEGWNSWSLHYDTFVYSPNFDEMFDTASDFLEKMVEIANTYYDSDGELHERVDYCAYKGRLFKDLVKMSESELEVIDNGSSEFTREDVGDYIAYLNEEAHNPKSWMEGVEITEELIDYHIRSRINRGIKNCEKYCSPSLKFFKLAEKLYQMRNIPKICAEIRELGARKTIIAFNPVCNKDGSSDAKIYYYTNEHDAMYNECIDVTVKTIGELQYLKANLPNASDITTSFWDDQVLLFCDGYFIRDKEFQMVDGLILYCKIESKKLYYTTCKECRWYEVKPKSLEERKKWASEHPLRDWRYDGLATMGVLDKMVYALTYYTNDIMMAVMSDYDSFYCEGTGLIGNTFQLRY